ncbi:dihydroflavonol-4-reductase [Sinobacterium caligoides]|uniref:Dihydroflavonol-4-reductase n=1 Tax=Sinobacterium caligoides TaxID=933926 RepID=A0A3N2DZ58_9GAMM|nr:NAD-dependent epimerase/dehydratase family protein [Sinobacterium caligoides]ROS05100.1 dihydroflavonol-4-reductase [Sinobacterium caligoides]
MNDLTKNPVMVTGATGYVAGWLIKQLLEMGCTVHACVRNPDDERKLAPLKSLTNEPQRLRFFKTDLLDEGSYQQAMKGCSVVFHTASPFTIIVDDPQRDLVDPAVKGTINVLNTVNDTPSVERVVLTSSVAAIYSDNIDALTLPKQTFTEEHWNEHSSLQHNPYAYSKTVAEKSAWQQVKKQRRWDLVVINPSFVVGPALGAAVTSDSFDVVKKLGDGTLKFGAPHTGIGLVDVQDVANAHIQAAIRPEAAGRYIVSALNSHLLEMADFLRPNYGTSYPLPKSKTPKFLAWLLGPMVGTTRKSISRNLGYSWKADNSKSKQELGIEYRSISEAINAMFAQLESNNQL